MDLQKKMLQELEEKTLLNQARDYAFEYIDGTSEMDVFPSKTHLEQLTVFDEALHEESTPAEKVLEQLHRIGSPNTVAHTGGRYYGFVLGGAIPVSLGARWLADVWDQCGGLYLTSPINAQLEKTCESWMKDLFGFPAETVAGFVTGTSMANLCALAAARFQLLKNQGWDLNAKGLNGAPAIRILAHEQVHASIRKTLVMLGFGSENVEWLPSDDQGRLAIDQLPELDATCLILLQAGNANTGAFDDFETVCTKANKVGAWVHVDGAFGLWAAATKSLRHLTKGVEKASSWAVDGHKTLNTPYDSGIVLCRHAGSLVSALQATGEYIIYTDNREPLLYTPELSRRARAVELWATMKYLGKSGIDEMITGFHEKSKQLEKGLSAMGLNVINEVVFNQVLVACDTEEQTKEMVASLQESGECWLGGTTWKGKAAIRISVCSWQTTDEDIERMLLLFNRFCTT